MALSLLLAIAIAWAPAGAGAGAPAGVGAVPIANFNQPVGVASAPGRPRQLFVVEKPGIVRILRDGVTDLANNEADDVQPLLAAPIPYVTGFSTHAAGRVYFVSIVNGNLYRLEPSTP